MVMAVVVVAVVVVTVVVVTVVVVTVVVVAVVGRGWPEKEGTNDEDQEGKIVS